MISLKKHLDLSSDALNEHLKPRHDDLLALTLDSYRSALAAMGALWSAGVEPLEGGKMPQRRIGSLAWRG